MRDPNCTRSDIGSSIGYFNKGIFCRRIDLYGVDTEFMVNVMIRNLTRCIYTRTFRASRSRLTTVHQYSTVSTKVRRRTR